MNEIGFVNFWGITPSFNLFKSDIELLYNTKIQSESQPIEINILLINTNDIRFILQSIKDIVEYYDTKDIPYKITYYVYENNLENISRDVLFLELIHTETLNIKEKVEYFLEIYGNTLLSEKVNLFIDTIYKNLIKLICDDKIHNTHIKELVSFKELSFKERDSLQEILSSYSKLVEYNIEKFRDDRVRFHYKDRYDYRENLIDWDYQMVTKTFSPWMGYNVYKNFRLTGISFENRLNKYTFPNKTLSSYIPGRSKQSKDSIMVRGYWGDLINSPYISFGISCDTNDENDFFKKIRNDSYIFNSKLISEYNILKILYRIEFGSDYYKTFTSIDKVTNQNLEDESLLTTGKDLNSNKMLKDENLNQLLENSQMLFGFKKAKAKIIFMSGDFKKTFEKNKYSKKFDFVLFGFHSKNHIDMVRGLFKNEQYSRVYYEMP